MNKQLLYAVIISIGIMMLWSTYFSPPPQAPVTTTETKSTAPINKPATAASSQSETVPSVASTVRPSEEKVVLDTESGTYVFSTWGASLRAIRLKEKQFLLKKNDPQSGIQIVSTSSEEDAPLRTTFAKAEFSFAENLPWTVTRPIPTQVFFHTETPDVVMEKQYTAEPLRHRLKFNVVLQNKTKKPQEHSLVVHLATKQDPTKKSGGFFDYASANLAETVCHANDKVTRAVVEALQKDPIHSVGGIRWFAAGDKYFTIAVVPFLENPVQDRACKAWALDSERAATTLAFASRSIPPGGRTEYPFFIYAGPKYTADLDAVRLEGQDVKLADVVDVTFAILSRPMLSLLRQFYGLTGNWGIAIILLTLFVKIVTFYPTHRMLVSAKKMQGMSDKVAALRKKLGEDKQKLGAETMKLYKDHGVSPFGGCLPSLIQMPIWIALFSTLNYSVELYHSAFFGYITDLSAKDPYYLAPLLMGAVMYLQMRMSPPGTDPQQQKMMAIMMPVMFTGFSLFLPAGLSIYTLTSYLIGIIQQLFVNWMFRRKPVTVK
jgi:YidC/Oxa1 family membrane protein insertase